MNWLKKIFQQEPEIIVSEHEIDSRKKLEELKLDQDRIAREIEFTRLRKERRGYE